ncbi:hypothetical protein M8J71_11895 [Pseudarthrobacter sp. R1]|uniref:hypothetical protein n=1 Tax=Pseudarthrobacter sp. R1 TaxID=2944934 RepID=UPI00210EDD7E|nr:hypothetical protein [Pseudarthrobacter sp. R1]MCQ6271185.1 hypothetical protein [Pseudarthrobacter sp. R1]
MHRRRIIVPAALLITALALTGFLVTTKQQPSAPVTTGQGPASAAAKTSFQGLPAPAGEPDLPALHAPGPGKGKALQVPGPFDDRFVLEGLAFNGSAVSGTVRVTGTTSELLDLQVLAGFYDDKGSLLGTARFDHHLATEEPNSGTPAEPMEFAIDVPDQYQDAAVSAAVGVPVFVTE